MLLTFWVKPHKVRSNYIVAERDLADVLLKKGWGVAKEQVKNTNPNTICIEYLDYRDKDICIGQPNRR
jgi:hypothetical protein